MQPLSGLHPLLVKRVFSVSARRVMSCCCHCGMCGSRCFWGKSDWIIFGPAESSRAKRHFAIFGAIHVGLLQNFVDPPKFYLGCPHLCLFSLPSCRLQTLVCAFMTSACAWQLCYSLPFQLWTSYMHGPMPVICSPAMR